MSLSNEGPKNPEEAALAKEDVDPGELKHEKEEEIKTHYALVGDREGEMR